MFLLNSSFLGSFDSFLKARSSDSPRDCQVAAVELAQDIEALVNTSESRPYFLFVEGHGDGCDYTLGCNLAVHRIEASSAQELLSRVREEWEDSGRGDIKWKSARLFAEISFIGRDAIPPMMDLIGSWEIEHQMPYDPEFVCQETRAQLVSSKAFADLVNSTGLTVLEIGLVPALDMSRWTNAVHTYVRQWAAGDHDVVPSHIAAHLKRLLDSRSKRDQHAASSPR